MAHAEFSVTHMSQHTGPDDVLKSVSSTPWSGNDAEIADCEAMARALQMYFIADANLETDGADNRQQNPIDIRRALPDTAPTTTSTSMWTNAALEDCDNMACALARYFPDPLKSDVKDSTLASQSDRVITAATRNEVKSPPAPANTTPGFASSIHGSSSQGVSRAEQKEKSQKPVDTVPSMTQTPANKSWKVSNDLSEAPRHNAEGTARQMDVHKTPQFGGKHNPQDEVDLELQDLPPVLPESNFAHERVVSETPGISRDDWFERVPLDTETVYVNVGESIQSGSVVSLPDKDEVAETPLVSRMARNATEMEDLRTLGPSVAEQYREVTSRASGDPLLDAYGPSRTPLPQGRNSTELLQYTPSPWPDTGGTPAPTMVNSEKNRRSQSSLSFWELQSPSPFEAQAQLSPSPCEADLSSPQRSGRPPNGERFESPEESLAHPSDEVTQAWQLTVAKGMHQLCDEDLQMSNDELRRDIQQLKAEVERRRREQSVWGAALSACKDPIPALGLQSEAAE